VITAKEGTPASVPQASGVTADTFEMGNHPIVFGPQTERYYEWYEDEKRLVIFCTLPKGGSDLVAAFNVGTLYAEGDPLCRESEEQLQWCRWLSAVQQERKFLTAWAHGNDSILGCLLSTVQHQEAQIEKHVEILTGEGKRHDPVIRGKGVPIWVLVSYVQKRGLTPEQVSELWEGYITPDEVRAALMYQKKFPDKVRDPLIEEA